jgi:cell division protein FtsI (penicillin-binding protein 3)
MNEEINKNIVLEEYEDSFLYKKNKSNLNIQFNRVAFIFFIIFIISLIYSVQLIHLGSLKSNIKIKNIVLNKKNYRADVIDNNGIYLVKTVSSINIGINPIDVINKKKLLINLQLIFPQKNFVEIKKKLSKNKFFYVEKKIAAENYEKIMLLGDKSIKQEEKLTRIYPQENLFSHIIGQIDDDNNGISGIEKSFDKELKEIKKPLKLTVDTNIQFLIRQELVKFQKIFRAQGSAAILMDVNNGEIISMVSLPDFNPNKRETIKDVNYINRVTKGVYELGSVFKTFTVAAGINEGLIEPDTEFLNLEKELPCDKFIIKEYSDKTPTDLTVEQILIRSGNVGSVKIGQKIGEEKFKSFLDKIGVLNKIKFDIEEVGEPISINWGKCKLATASYGHGITTTLLQLAKGYSIIVNGGFDIQPTIIKKKEKKNQSKKKILNDSVSNKMNRILRKIVVNKEGTAELANVNGYDVGGKTGTAQKSKNGKYSRAKINTFAAIFPTKKPRYTLIVMLDEPKTNSEYIYHYRDGKQPIKGTPRNTAGWTSVEVTGKIIEKIGPILATKYIEIN